MMVVHRKDCRSVFIYIQLLYYVQVNLRLIILKCTIHYYSIYIIILSPETKTKYT